MEKYLGTLKEYKAGACVCKDLILEKATDWYDHRVLDVVSSVQFDIHCSLLLRTVCMTAFISEQPAKNLSFHDAWYRPITSSSTTLALRRHLEPGDVVVGRLWK